MSIRVLNKFPLVEDSIRLALVGEAPGMQEEMQGAPFVGPAGHVLNQLCSDAKVKRNTCFIGNICQYNIPHTTLLEAGKELYEWKQSTEQLVADLLKFAPQVIVAFGEVPLRFLTGKEGITRWRGSILPCLQIPSAIVFPTYHPAFILRQWDWFAIASHDLERAYEEATNPRPLPERHFIFKPSLQEILNYLSALNNLPEGSEVALDFETEMKSALPICLGIAPSEKEAICIPLSTSHWSPEDRQLIISNLNTLLLANPRLSKIMHNAQFDILVAMLHLGTTVEGITDQLGMDTMLAFHACYPEWPKKLAFAASIFTREPYWKDEHHGDKEDSEVKEWDPNRTDILKLYRYNCKDACVTFELAQAIKKELTRLNAWGGYQLDMRSMPIALAMTIQGMTVNSEVTTKKHQELQAQISTNSKEIEATFGHPVNVNSKNDMQQLLYVQLGLPKKFRQRTKGKQTVTSDADALIELARQFPKNNLQVLLRTRQLRTAQTFFEPDLFEDKKFHAGFNVAGTETGRWSSTGSFLGGRNLMNIPDGSRPPFVNARVIYEADPGKILVHWDQAQAEARFVAYKSALVTGDTSYKDLVDSGTKIHVWFGRRAIDRGIFHINPDDLKSGTVEYYLSKQSVHGFSYGLGPLKWTRLVAKQTTGAVVVSVETAKRLKFTLYEVLPAIPKWQLALQRWLEGRYLLYNSYGRARVFFGRWGDELFGQVYAAEPQGTIADNTASALHTIAEVLPEVDILQQNYDSGLFQCDEALLPAVVETMKPIVTRPIRIWNFEKTRSLELTIPVEFKTGKNWGELEDYK